MNIRTLEVYSKIEEGKYRGISKRHFPKWEGWDLENGEREEAVDRFYMVYFYYSLKLDLVEDEVLEKLILNFSTLQGKKKAISKLEKVCGLPMTGKTSSLLMEYAANNHDYVLYKYILEIIEFYDFIHKPQEGLWALDVYRYL